MFSWLLRMPASALRSFVLNRPQQFTDDVTLHSVVTLGLCTLYPETLQLQQGYSTVTSHSQCRTCRCTDFQFTRVRVNNNGAPARRLGEELAIVPFIINTTVSKALQPASTGSLTSIQTGALPGNQCHHVTAVDAKPQADCWIQQCRRIVPT